MYLNQQQQQEQQFRQQQEQQQRDLLQKQLQAQQQNQARASASAFEVQSFINSTERNLELEEAVSAAQRFHKLYYDTLEKRRHVARTLYMDEAVIIWNGHGIAYMPQIQKFFEELPVGTYTVFSVDAQPVAQEAVGSLKTIVVTVAGIWRLPEEAPTPFQQTFIITAQGDKWKIVSDVFRSQEKESDSNPFR